MSQGMSQGLFGGLFPSRGAQAPPASMDNSPLADDFRLADAAPGADTGADAGADVDCSFQSALDALPVNVMFCDRELILCYLNRSSRKTLLGLQPYLPMPVDQMVGKSIRLFHRAPENIDRILGSAQHRGHRQLPHKTVIKLGPVKLDLEVAPMIGEHGEYVGAVVVWSAQQAAGASQKVQESQRNDLEHLNGNLQIAATATHEIDASIAEIARDAVKLAQTAAKSRAASVETKASILRLHTSSSGVAKVAELIASIATQTSVLALNANIEAARAGMHGKGFAVVASEVRKLAEQTAAATAEIQAKVSAIGADISTAIAAIGRISSQIEEFSGLSQQMAAAAEEQHLATQEMAHHVERAAFRTAEIANTRFEEKGT